MEIRDGQIIIISRYYEKISRMEIVYVRRRAFVLLRRKIDGVIASGGNKVGRVLPLHAPLHPLKCIQFVLPDGYQTGLTFYFQIHEIMRSKWGL